MSSEGMTNRERAHAELVDLARSVVNARQHPLLVLFYPGGLSIAEEQIEQLHTLLTRRGLKRSSLLDSLDVLIHTYGGEPTAAYRLAQVIRNFAKRVHFLVPEYAFSGGTLICLAGDDILLGDYAVLSPIDITLHGPPPNQGLEDPKFPEEETPEIELVAIDHFIKAAVQARIEVEREFRLKGFSLARSQVESEMLRQMVEELGVIEIGRFYREKNLTLAYANELLTSYMFVDKPDTERSIQRILSRLIVESPSHEFPMDYHICVDVGLEVDEMDEDLGALTRQLTRRLQDMDNGGLLSDRAHGQVLPFFELFHYPVSEANDSAIDSVSETRDGHDLQQPEGRQRDEHSATAADMSVS